MTNEQLKELELGLYRFHWKSGGSSVGVMFQTYDGKKAIMCANWTTRHPRAGHAILEPTGYTSITDDIERFELIAEN